MGDKKVSVALCRELKRIERRTIKKIITRMKELQKDPELKAQMEAEIDAEMGGKPCQIPITTRAQEKNAS